MEGPEGGGKTSQARALAARLGEAGMAVLLTREPGGTELGKMIREIVLPATSTPISARSEVLLYSASRAQLIEEVVTPALAAGQLVVSDRFSYSTIAYQGYGRGLDLEGTAAVTRFATGGLEPDLCLLLDLPPEEGIRPKARGLPGRRHRGVEPVRGGGDSLPSAGAGRLPEDGPGRPGEVAGAGCFVALPGASR